MCGVNKQNHAFALCTIQVFIIKGKVLLLLYKGLIVNEIFCHVFSWWKLEDVVLFWVGIVP